MLIPGDSNFDGVFDSEDLVVAFLSGEYEDNVTNNSTFQEGDWNGDGEFDSSDFVFVFQSGQYSKAARAFLSMSAVRSVFDGKEAGEHIQRRFSRSIDFDQDALEQ